MEFSVASLLILLALALLPLFLLYSFVSTVHHTATSPSNLKKLPLPPQPPSLPLIGHMHLVGHFPHRSLELLSHKYGPLMLLRLGSLRVLIASSPSLAKEIFHSQDLQFLSKPETPVTRILSRDGRNLALSNGPHWRFARKLCAVELLAPNRVQSFTALREEEASNMLRSIWKQCQLGGIVDIRNELWRVVYDNICRMVMGQKHTGTEDPEVLRTLLEEFIPLSAAFKFSNFFPSLSWLDFSRLEGRAKMLIAKLDRVFQEIIDERRQIGKSNPDLSKNFLDVLLSLAEGYDEQHQIYDTSIIAIMNDMFVAGTETSAFTTEWAMSEMLRCPLVRKRAQEELDSVVGRDRKVCESDLSQLTYLHAIVKETFRLRTLAPLLPPHVNENDCELAGYFIPAGTWVLVNLWAMGRNPQLWANPLEFCPERFLGSEIDVKGTNFELLPFGAGRRICPGLNVGHRLVHLLLASLLQAFDWELPGGQKPEDLDMSEEFLLMCPRAKRLMGVPSLRVPPTLLN